MTKEQPLTKAYLDSKLDTFAEIVRRDIRDLAQHFTRQFAAIDRRFDGVDRRLDSVETQLEAIKESLVFRRELENLVRELKSKGIALRRPADLRRLNCSFLTT